MEAVPAADILFAAPACRLAVAMQHLGQPHKAVALLEPFFARGKQIFTVNMTPILVSPKTLNEHKLFPSKSQWRVSKHLPAAQLPLYLVVRGS